MRVFNMGKISTVIVEDNRHSRDELKRNLEKFTELEIVGEAENGEDAVTLIDTRRPDLLFLDIELPRMDGFEVLKAAVHLPMVIFVSAHDHYAVHAFEADGIDYLLKPIETRRLEKALDRVLRRNIMPDHRIIEALRKLTLRHNGGKRFAVKVKDQILIVPKEDVYFFKAEDKYVFLNTWDGSYFYQSTLKTLIDALDSDSFFRVNKSTIVSLDKVHKINRNFKREFCVVMGNKERSTFKISKRSLSAFRSALVPFQRW